MADELCRWGILGTAQIARKNWKAIRNAGNSRVTSVASRSIDRARQFIAECQSHTPQPAEPHACGGYEELLRREDIDAVYIPLPTAIRNSGNSTLVAVASRSLDRARQFIAECQSHVPFDPAPVACAGYEELLRRDDIDAVYVPLPTGVRREWVVRAAEAGKHVLCESRAASTRPKFTRCSRPAGTTACSSWTA